MAHDARVSSALISHHKTKKLRRRLGPGACWSLVALFAYASEHKWNGDLSGMSDEDIAIAADWDAEPADFCNALSAVNFLEGESGSYSIHDWADHQPYAAARDERSESARNAVSKRWEYARNTPRTDAGNTKRIRTEYASDTPNQTKPNTIKPSAAKPAAVADSRFDSTKKFIERCCEHAKVPFLWGPGEAKQLSDWLKQAPGVDIEGVQQLVRNRYRSNEPAGKRPREWIPHLSSYAVGPVDRFGKDTVQAEDKLPNVNELRAQQRKQAALVGG